MLDISWSEIFVVLIVAIIVIKPEDMPTIKQAIKVIRRIFKNITTELSAIKKELKLDDILEDEKDNKEPQKKLITDIEGNLREVYDLSDLAKTQKFGYYVLENKDEIDENSGNKTIH